MHSGGSTHSTNSDGGGDDGNGGGDCRQLTLCLTSNNSLPSQTEVSSSNPQSDDQQVVVFDLSSLPEGLLQEILVRLPLKSLFSFKCVSSEWKSMISSHFFSRLYASRKLNFRIMYRYVYVSYFWEIVDRLNHESHACPPENFSVLYLSNTREHSFGHQFKVLAVSKGLLLCCMLAPLTYYIGDPVTKEWVTLPRPDYRSITRRRPTYVGEGFVPLANEDNLVTSYKVIRIEWHSTESDDLQLQTLYSETGEWSDYNLSCPQRVKLFKRGSPFVFNGAMHWFAYGNRVVAFDPYKVEGCRLIDLPNYRDIESENQYDGSYHLCEECQWKLRYFEAAPDITEYFCFSMWIMRDYERGEWNLVHRATRNEIWSDDPYLRSYLLHAHFLPLLYHPFNLDVVYLRCEERSCIVAYDIKTKRLEVSCHQPVDSVEDLSWRVVIPFVLPTWPTPLPRRARRE
ncbi:putative F-box/kelch-repeat protein At1g15680 [Camellia sinensis]|uniref:putative F-box/kelch-repeat protein At1g15680 n=1 Tax=Camellia sinensis TaxID=4442 RepID=UPI001036D164|nr:putative F-box/kelch-repeat protein At1g15680 [Camellia sinensis]